MRIAQIISHYVPSHRFGGPLQVAHGLGKALVARGHHVSVCTTNLADEKRDLDVPIDTPIDVDGVKVFYEPTCWSRYWGFSPRLWRRATSEIASADVALVHFHYQFANWAGARLSRKLGTPYVVFAHGSLKRDAIARRSRWKKSLYLKWVEGGNLRQAERLFFNASEERDNSLFGERGAVLSNGVDIQMLDRDPAGRSLREQYPHLRGKTVFLFLGRVDYHGKGLDVFLRAFARLVRERPACHWFVVGPDERGGARLLQQAIVANDLCDHVTLTGMITGDEKLAVLRDCDVFVLPSRSEGLSIALLEALYVGLPVLVSDRVGLCGEIARLQAGIVTPVDDESLHRALTKMADATNTARMRGNAVEWIRRDYSWPTIADKLLDELPCFQAKTSCCSD